MLSLGCAFFYALHGLASKIAQERYTSLEVSYYTTLFAAPLYFLALLLSPSFTFDLTFFKYLFLSFAVNLFVIWLFIQALRESPLSATYPTLGLSPAFMLLTTPLMTKESPQALGVMGILFAVAGFFLLGGLSLNAFLQFLRREKGVQKMLLVAFLWSISANIDKLAILHASPEAYAFAINLMLAAGYRLFLWQKPQKSLKGLGALIMASTALVLMALFQFHAVKVGIPSLVIALKRSGMLFAVLFDIICYREKNVYLRLPGIAAILAGVVMMGLSVR